MNTLAVALRLSAPLVPMIRTMIQANTRTTRCRIPKWYKTVKNEETKMTAGKALTTKMKPPPWDSPSPFSNCSAWTSGPKTKEAPASENSINFRITSLVATKKSYTAGTRRIRTARVICRIIPPTIGRHWIASKRVEQTAARLRKAMTPKKERH